MTASHILFTKIVEYILRIQILAFALILTIKKTLIFTILNYNFTILFVILLLPFIF